MKEGWEYKKLDDVCTIVGRIGFRGYTKADLVNSSKDGAITLSPSNIINGELDFSKCTYINWDKYYESPEIMLENGDIVLVKTASIGKCAVVKNLPHEATLNPQFVVLKHLVGVPDFICYYLKSSIAQNTIKQMAGGVAIPTLSQKKLGMMIVPTPSQDEQQSIVDYLDSAFAKIDAMKANAEKALNEAKALFQASLKEMLEPKEGWEECLLTKEFSLKSGDYLSSKMQKTGDIPVYGGNGITGYHNSHNYDGNQLLIGRVGALCGNIHLTYEKIWVTDNAFVVKDIKDYWDIKFLKYELDFLNLNQYASQSAQPVISNKSMRDVIVQKPSFTEQQSIVSTLDSLKSKVDRLKANYDKISQECDALKQAILRQVFE